MFDRTYHIEWINFKWFWIRMWFLVIGYRIVIPFIVDCKSRRIFNCVDKCFAICNFSHFDKNRKSNTDGALVAVWLVIWPVLLLTFFSTIPNHSTFCATFQFYFFFFSSLWISSNRTIFHFTCFAFWSFDKTLIGQFLFEIDSWKYVITVRFSKYIRRKVTHGFTDEWLRTDVPDLITDQYLRTDDSFCFLVKITDITKYNRISSLDIVKTCFTIGQHFLNTRFIFSKNSNIFGLKYIFIFGKLRFVKYFIIPFNRSEINQWARTEPCGSDYTVLSQYNLYSLTRICWYLEWKIRINSS